MATKREVTRFLRESCRRKRAFASWEEAEAACLQLRESPDYKDGRNGAPLCAYKCVFEEHWHIGRTSGKATRRRRRVEETLARGG